MKKRDSTLSWFTRFYHLKLLNIVDYFDYFYIRYDFFSSAEAQSQDPFTTPTIGPKIIDSRLKAELIYSGPGFPTNMAFIGPDDILFLSKNDGKVLRIKDGKNLGPVLEVNVSKKDEMGLLGIATEQHNDSKVSH